MRGEILGGGGEVGRVESLVDLKRERQIGAASGYLHKDI